MDCNSEDKNEKMQNLIDIILKQHDAFKYQTGAFIDTLYVTPNNSSIIKKVKANLNEVYIFSCKISSLLEEAKLATDTREQDKGNEDANIKQGININIKLSNDSKLGIKEFDKKKLTTKNVNKEDIYDYASKIEDNNNQIKHEQPPGFYGEWDFNIDSLGYSSGFNIFKQNNSGFKVKNENTNSMNIIDQLDFDKINSKGLSNRNIFDENSLHKNFEPVFENYNNKDPLIKNELTNVKIESPNCDQKNTSIGGNVFLTNKKRKRGSYKIVCLETKLEAVRLARITSIKEASESLKIPEKNIKRWLRNGPERKKGAGRKTTDPNMEKHLLQWIAKEYRNTGQFPDSKEIKRMAKDLTRYDEFKASKGWCDKFLRRNALFFEYLKEETIGYKKC